MTAPPSDPRTYAACLTPSGTGAIAVIAVRGPSAWEVVQAFFRTRDGSPLAPSANLTHFWLGRFGDDAADVVVLSVMRWEPTPWLELHCHGGVAVVRWCLQLLEGRGIQICSWQQLQRLTGDHVYRATVTEALVKAPTVRTATILLDQYHGAFADALTTLVGEDNDERFGKRLKVLAARVPLGRHLTTPWRVVIAGAPNVGKSSLANALAGYQRSIVSPTPGTTRDAVACSIAVEGWPVELVDTAGLRYGAEAIERAGIGLARAAVASADLCLWVIDGSAPPEWPDVEAAKLRIVVNKADLPPAWEWRQCPDAPRVSARTSAGVAELAITLARWLVPDAAPAGAAVPFNEAMCDGIEAAQRDWVEGCREEARQRMRDLERLASGGR